MNKALVIGASGSFGGEMTRELVRHGFQVRALRRSGGRALDVPGLEIVPGSALDLDSVRAAARGVDTIVYSYNVPYAEWHTKLLSAADVVATVAAENSATLLFPGNVYGLRPDPERALDEATPRNAPTRKGELRNAVEERLQQASRAGVRVIVLRAGDFMGGQGATSWYGTMTARLARSNRVLEPSPGNVPHEWAFLPDLVRAGRRLLERDVQSAGYEEYHFSSYQITNQQLLRVTREIWGEPFKTRALPWSLVTLLSPFVPMLRELREMRYLWTEQLLLDDSKLRKTLPDLTKTPLPEAIEFCLRPELEARAARSARHSRARA